MASAARDRLLDATIAHLAEHGLGDTSLRGIAQAIGTSHRMLNYHFGGRTQLLTAVSREVERRQRAWFAAMLDQDTEPVTLMREMHQRLSDPALHAQERLFFELYARALVDPAEVDGFLPEAVEAWLEPSTELFRRLGFGDADARAEARLSLAVARGLILDSLATGDEAAVGAAAERYLARYAAPVRSRG